jgi:ASC-1-like (ASCH) protein
MLYRILEPETAVTAFDAPDITVEEMRPAHAKQVRTLLLTHLRDDFLGIDDAWVESLFAGFARRHKEDVNQKYKIIFVATNRAGDVIGVAGATPKKGKPIKIMPLIATSLSAFSSLITDIPFLLRKHGRKLYTHLVPTVPETIALQSRGWKLDAALPAAYHADRVTLQWSLDIDNEDFMRQIRVKQRFLDHIKMGTKTLEVRVAYDDLQSIRAGDRIRFASRDDYQIVRVREVRTYPSFVEMEQHESLHEIIPDATPEDVMKTLRGIYPPNKEGRGILVLEVEPIADDLATA